MNLSSFVNCFASSGIRLTVDLEVAVQQDGCMRLSNQCWLDSNIQESLKSNNGGRRPNTGRTARRPQTKKLADISAHARGYGLKAVEVLYNVMTDPGETGAVRIKAAKELLDRGYGKVTEPLPDKPEVKHSLDLKRLDDEELRWFVRITMKARVPITDESEDSLD